MWESIILLVLIRVSDLRDHEITQTFAGGKGPDRPGIMLHGGHEEPDPGNRPYLWWFSGATGRPHRRVCARRAW